MKEGTWMIESTSKTSYRAKELLADGWEPFAVTEEVGLMYHFRKFVPIQDPK